MIRKGPNLSNLPFPLRETLNQPHCVFIVDARAAGATRITKGHPKRPQSLSPPSARDHEPTSQFVHS